MMATGSVSLALAGLALVSGASAAAIRTDEGYTTGIKAQPIIIETPESYGVTWKQTKVPTTNQQQGALGASVRGHFPVMSPNETSVGCGLDWSRGQLHAGFNAGDGGNGVGGGFTWLPNALSSVVGVHFRDTKVNVNLTITDDNQVIFSVDGKELDWNKVIRATKTQDPNVPVGPDAGPVQYDHGHAFANDVPEYHYPDGKEKSTKTKRADLPSGPDAGPVQFSDGHAFAVDVPEYRNADGSVAH
ncbi:uncharacterized protein PAN0_003d1735 [Moesziomyces antarcticus]|uniref:Uncharacterized protein n=1 Tax=Pseudozyma antarctica TaxID=84753 RepID=A0A5C3FIW0_PSEA2|nr:uncharacterized protein PAN0_003d1735 [Moesziomyces antarcticus]GAK63530.1 conserved hypothetical protein [Moesziomyces antarcticus]SPO44120.1 uncharacterized protein PSANT_01805 [Moesziomyces antarcticus]